MWSEDTFSTRQPKNYYMSEAKWTGVWTTRLLFEAGIGVSNGSRLTGEGAARTRGLHRRRNL